MLFKHVIVGLKTALSHWHQLSLKSLNRRETRLGETSCTATYAPLEVSSFAQDIDGLIGLDFLSRSARFTIDYRAKTVSFHLADKEAYRPGATGPLLIQLNIQGVSVDLVVDTGFPGIVLYENRLHARLPGLRTTGRVQPVNMGSLHLTMAKVSNVSLNGTTADRDVYFVDENAKRPIPEIDGAFGPVALKAKWLEFDFVGHKMLWSSDSNCSSVD